MEENGTKKGYTLWERWTGKVPSEPDHPEQKLNSPLKLKCKDIVINKALSEHDRTYTVAEVREYHRRIAGTEFYFADYLLRDGNELRILRAIPRLDRDPDDKRECDLLWLSVYKDMQFDAGLREAVMQNELNETDDTGNTLRTFSALNAGKDGFLARITSVEAGKECFAKRKVRYWDFFRKGERAKGEPEGEDIFLFVEFDEEDGYIVMLLGTTILSPEIEIYPRSERQ
jgi:hypothetical protein